MECAGNLEAVPSVLWVRGVWGFASPRSWELLLCKYTVVNSCISSEALWKYSIWTWVGSQFRHTDFWNWGNFWNLEEVLAKMCPNKTLHLAVFALQWELLSNLVRGSVFSDGRCWGGCCRYCGVVWVRPTSGWWRPFWRATCWRSSKSSSTSPSCRTCSTSNGAWTPFQPSCPSNPFWRLPFNHCRAEPPCWTHCGYYTMFC